VRCPPIPIRLKTNRVIEGRTRSRLVIAQKGRMARWMDQRDMDRIFNLKPRNREALVALGAWFARAASASPTRLFSQEPNNPLEPTPVPSARSVWLSGGAAQLCRWATP